MSKNSSAWLYISLYMHTSFLPLCCSLFSILFGPTTLYCPVLSDKHARSRFTLTCHSRSISALCLFLYCTILNFTSKQAYGINVFCFPSASPFTSLCHQVSSAPRMKLKGRKRKWEDVREMEEEFAGVDGMPLMWFYVSEGYAQLIGSSPPPPPIATISGPYLCSTSPSPLPTDPGFNALLSLSLLLPSFPHLLFPILLLALLTFSTILSKGSLNPSTQTFVKP